MGALNMEIEKVNKKISNIETAKKQKENERKQKELARQKEKLQKELEKGGLIQVKNELRNIFNNYISKNGIDEAEIHFNILHNREMTRNILVDTIHDGKIKGLSKDVLGDYIESNYNKILKEEIEKFKADQLAQNKIITKYLYNELSQNPKAMEIAKSIGYDKEKIYTNEDIKALNEKINKINEQIQAEKIDRDFERRINKTKNIFYSVLYCLFALFNPLMLILYFILYLLFKFSSLI